MRSILKIEEFAKFILSYVFSQYLGFSWWIFFIWLLVPDLSMLGYLFNTKTGAFTYNLIHHQAFAIFIGLLGMALGSVEMQFAGLLLFGHSAMDRMFGYGLKYSDDFKHTHLGYIGKTQNTIDQAAAPEGEGVKNNGSFKLF